MRGRCLLIKFPPIQGARDSVVSSLGDGVTRSAPD